MRIDALPNKDFMPPNFPNTDTDAVSSVKAPPMAVKPLAISSQDIFPKDSTASANILQLSARATIATLVDKDTLLFPMIFTAPVNTNRLPPIPTKPFPISSKERSEKLSAACANISTAPAIVIKEIPALITPLESNFFIDFVIERKPRFNSAIITPIAVSPFPICFTFSFAIEFNDADNIPIATAMPIKDPTFIPAEKESKESCIEDRTFDTFSSIVEIVDFLSNASSKTSVIFSNTSDNFFATRNIPPPANPAKISPKEICSPIHSIMSPNFDTAFSNTSTIFPAKSVI